MNHEMPLLLWSGEEKVIGGYLSLRQFAYLAGGGGLAMWLLTLALRNPLFWPAVPLPAACALALAFAPSPCVGMQLDSYLAGLFSFRSRPKAFPYRRKGCAAGEEMPADGPGAQDVLGFTDIQEGIVSLPGGRRRLVCEVVGRVNFFLLSEEEQSKTDIRFQRFVLSLTFPVQIHVQSRYLDISGQIERVMKAGHAVGPEMAGYVRDQARYLQGMMQASLVLVQRVFLVIPYDGPDGHEAKAELERRANVLRATLGEDLSLRVLDTAEVLDVIYAAYNRERALYAPAAQAAEYGFLTPVVKGVMPSEITGSEEAAAAGEK